MSAAVTAARAGEGPRLRVQVAQRAPIPLDARFDCGPGELLALVGPSGSGKTTLLRAIAGLHRPAQGTIECGETFLDTARRVDRPPQARRVGFVFQQYALFPHMTALGNVAAALPPMSRTVRARRAAELLERVHLAGLEERYPAALSGGQQQRVAVARALAREPRVLLLDEPFSAVDRVTRQKLYRELAELRRSLAMPVVLVTHDLDEAAALADRLCIVHRGRTLQIGTADEVMLRPADALVARLVDQRNVGQATVVAGSPGTTAGVLDWHGYRLEVADLRGRRVGDTVEWLVPVAGIIMHRRDRPSRGERENPLPGVVTHCLGLGQDLIVTLQVDRAQTLELRVPRHVAARNAVDVGARMSVSLLADMIHVMPPAPPPE